jgi:hypothetical protein
LVAWVFAGGGDSEIRGLIPFLRMRFSGYDFERKTPVRQKRGPKPGVKIKDTCMGKSINHTSVTLMANFHTPQPRTESC